MEDADVLKASSGSGPAVIAKVQRPRSRGGKIIDVDSTANWPDKFIATYGRLNSNGSILPDSVVEFVGRKSGAEIEIINFEPGFSDVGNKIGDIVVVKPTTGFANRVANYFLEASNKFKNLVEYSFIASPNDLNDAQFLVPGKWRFGNNQQVNNTKNLPVSGVTGMLETISYSGGHTRPGANPWSYIIQVYMTLEGRVYIRPISSAGSASNITYGAWVKLARQEIKKYNKDSRGWIKRELPDGVIEYCTSGSLLNVHTSAGGWVSDILSLPTEIASFNAEKMATTVNVRGTDAALSTSASIFNGATHFTVNRRNNHSGGVTCNIDYNIILRVYPE